jgi:CoA:oxalate CoA-transferase
MAMTPTRKDGGERDLLGDIKVLDFSFVMAGPYCTRLLADLGADVIKVETAEGDQMRFRPPLRDGASAYFAHLNCGKRSIVLDLKSVKGRKIAQRLASQVDVVVENFRPGVMRRLGLSYETLAALNPALVYCSVSGFGQTGPLAKHPAYAPVIHAASGFDRANQLYQDEPDRPLNCGIFVADILGGIYAFAAIQSALLQRTRSGAGQYIDVSMMDAMLGMLVYEVQEAQFPIAKRRFLFTPCRAADGFVMIAPTSERNFHQLCDALGHAEWKEDPRFFRQRVREQNWAVLMELVEAWTRERSAADCEAALLGHGVPCSRYNTVRELMDHPHFAQRSTFQRVHDDGGPLLVTNPPFRFSDGLAFARGKAPQLGEDTAVVLKSMLGVEEAEVTAPQG